MLHYPDELARGSCSQVLYFRPVIESKTIDQAPDSMLVSICDPSGRLVFSSGDARWNIERSRLELEMDLSDAELWPEGRNWRALFEIEYEEFNHEFDYHFDIVTRPWRPNLCPQDLAALAPLAILPGADGNKDVVSILAEAEDSIRRRARSSGFAPGLIADHSALDQVLQALALSLMYMRASNNFKQGYWEKHEAWHTKYESLWAELVSSSRYDADGDGSIVDEAVSLAPARLKP